MLRLLNPDNPGLKIAVQNTYQLQERFEQKLGERVEGVRKITWEIEVGELATATIEFINVEAELDGVSDAVAEVTELGDKWKVYKQVRRTNE